MYDKELQVDLSPALQGNAADMEKQLRKEQEALMAKEEKVKVLMEQLKADKLKYDKLREEERLRDPTEMPPEEQRKVIESPAFQEFFTKSSRIIERALNQSSYDITIDYANDTKDDEDVEMGSLKVVNVFSDKKAAGRPVTSINWSHKYPELMAASYAGQNDPMSYDPDGTVLVWNLHMSSPEYQFECNSSVLSVQFHPTNPHLLVGACQSGQVVVWDTREKSNPVNRTSLSRGHTHPVYSLDHVPVVNKLHNIMSVSTDGHVCVWSDNNLHDPSHEVILSYGKEEITTTCFAKSKRDNDTILLGSDEGYVYKANVYDKKGIYEANEAHKAPITRVAFHPSQKSQNTSDLYLTSSYDWTVKLWSQKTNIPLYTFESARDYVHDVQWSPLHPAVFAMADGAGRIDLWDVNKDTDVPTHTAIVNENAASGDRAAINRIAWSEDGNHLSAGTSTGTISVFNISSEVAEPAADAATVFYDKIHSKLIA